MKRYIRLLAILLTAISVTSCQKDTLDNIIKEQGGFSLALTMTDNESVATRVAMTNKEAIDNANVKIYKPVFGGLIREYTYSSMPGVVYLPTGNGYRVDVSAGEIVSSSPRKANFEQKSYKGSAEFNVVANQVTDNVNVVAKICNAITNATKNIDERGSFTELVRTKECGQFSISFSKKGVIRGNHYHHTKLERFIVVKGKAKIRKSFEKA